MRQSSLLLPLRLVLLLLCTLIHILVSMYCRTTCIRARHDCRVYNRKLTKSTYSKVNSHENAKFRRFYEFQRFFSFFAKIVHGDGTCKHRPFRHQWAQEHRKRVTVQAQMYWLSNEHGRKRSRTARWGVTSLLYASGIFPDTFLSKGCVSCSTWCRKYMRLGNQNRVMTPPFPSSRRRKDRKASYEQNKRPPSISMT
jgi:hypothetical protein